MKESSRKNKKFELTELIGVSPDKVGGERFFAGTMKSVSVNTETYLLGQVKVNEGWIICTASDKDSLSLALDTLCKLKLDCSLHKPGLKKFKYPDTGLN